MKLEEKETSAEMNGNDHVASSSRPVNGDENLMSDQEIVEDILRRFNLEDETLTWQTKAESLCIIVKNLLDEVARFRFIRENLVEQLEKNEETRETLQKLIDALREQIKLTKAESNLKLKEERSLRIENCNSFEKTIHELSNLLETHSIQNTRLCDENKLMSKNLSELLVQYEKQELRLENSDNELELHKKCFEAKLNKVRLEKAELSADFTQERLKHHQDLLAARVEIDRAVNNEIEAKEQLSVYEDQYKELESGMGDSGVNLTHFRRQMENVTKKFHKLEVDSSGWKRQLEASEAYVRKMNADFLEREREYDLVVRKLAAMEKLNRVLQKERQVSQQQSDTETTLPVES